MTHAQSIEILKLTPERADDYRRIRLSAMRHEPDMLVSDIDDEAEQPLGYFEDKVRDNVVFAAYVDGDVAGMVGFTRRKGPKESHQGYLWGMYVERRHRRAGLAKLLNEAVIDYARDLVDTLDLKIISDNDSAIALCQEFGFRRYGTQPKALKFNSRYYDGALMFLDLTERAETESLPA